jgi:hypothetical protein
MKLFKFKPGSTNHLKEKGIWDNDWSTVVESVDGLYCIEYCDYTFMSVYPHVEVQVLNLDIYGLGISPEWLEEV